MSEIAHFYDRLAPFYHLLYGDWDVAVVKQGAALALLMDEYGVAPGSSVLDAASGIGTQTIGLASKGYKVTASDLSPGAIERLRRETSKRGLAVPAYLDDLRTLSQAPSKAFSAVVACDNSIPHLLTDAELLECFRNCVR
jgi:cyclopropane fatty-acyl-phospholipid synthase-like methyltransferase